MVTKSNFQETLSIPSGLSQGFKEELGKRIVEEVRERTDRGIDKNGKQFKGYTKEYKQSLDFKNAGKTSKVDLQLTGDLLAELDVVTISSSSITIGYPVGHELAGQAEGNTIGSYGQSSGNTSRARDYIGLPDKVVNRIVQEIRSEPQFKEERATRTGLIAGILSRFQ